MFGLTENTALSQNTAIVTATFCIGLVQNWKTYWSILCYRACEEEGRKHFLKLFFGGLPKIEGLYDKYSTWSNLN